MLIKNLFRDYNIHKVVRHNRISPHHPYRISLNGSRFKIQEAQSCENPVVRIFFTLPQWKVFLLYSKQMFLTYQGCKMHEQDAF